MSIKYLYANIFLMDLSKPNINVIHPKNLIRKELKGIEKFNRDMAVRITKSIGTMWSAYLFCLLTFISLPAVLAQAFGLQIFPRWMVNVSLIALISWIAQTFLQLVLLPIIMVGQNVIQSQQDAKVEADHKTLTYIANLQEQQLIELRHLSQAIDHLINR